MLAEVECFGKKNTNEILIPFYSNRASVPVLPVTVPEPGSHGRSHATCWVSQSSPTPLISSCM